MPPSPSTASYVDTVTRDNWRISTQSPADKPHHQPMTPTDSSHPRSSKKPRITPRLRAAALKAMPLLQHFENQLASSLSADTNSHKRDREPRAHLNELIDALNEAMGITKGNDKPWDYAKREKLKADWVMAKIKSRDPQWIAPAIRPTERGTDVQWRSLWMVMQLEVIKANKAIHRLKRNNLRQALLIRQLKADPVSPPTT